MERNNGFSLIEVVVVMGILSLLVAGAFYVGLPEYDRYSIYSERDHLVDTLLESRTRSFVGEGNFIVSTWSNGYCIKDVTNLCVTPIHNLPSNMTLTSTDLATSTQMSITFTGASSGSLSSVEINIDQNDYIDGR